MVFTSEDAEIRFWKKVQKSDDNNCWIWLACRQGNNGYGYFRISKDLGHTVAHRYSYELHKGKIPDGMIICHSCDNPICVNPNHLFTGTHQTNAIDREKKRRGNHDYITKLTETQVLEIKSSLLSQSKLAKIYEVSRSTISSIKHGETWKYLSLQTDVHVHTNTCRICNKSSNETIFKDQNYKYRKIRDELCSKCNKALALFNNDILCLTNAKLFLETEENR
jgi:DNA-binding XRE family transcriptional regulator